MSWKKTYLAEKMGKYWVNIDIFKNLPNHLTPQPRRRFKSYKLKKNTLYIYIEYKILIKFIDLKELLFTDSIKVMIGNVGRFLLDNPMILFFF
jgi:hypothetical protein